jgi:predicted nucleic acid-binding protein
VKRLFVDTGAWFAYSNASDPDHRRVARAVEGFDGRLVTSNFVFDEVVTLCLSRFGHATAARVGTTLLDPVVTDLVRLTTKDERDAWALFLDRPDKDYSFTDCTSFVLMRRLRLITAAALDAHFQSEGFQVIPLA